MDTEALWQAIAAYGNARWRGYSHEIDAADHLSDIKRLLNEADEEHKSLLAENERLVDEVNEARKETSEQARLNGMGAEREARLMAEVAELKAKLTEKASLLRGCYAADHKQKQRIEELTAERDALREILDGVLKFDRGTSRRIIIEGWQEEVIRAALEKKHER